MPNEPITNGDWDSCKMYVLRELQRMNELHEKMDDKLDKLKDQLTMIQVKVAAIGAISAIVTAIIVTLVKEGLAK